MNRLLFPLALTFALAGLAVGQMKSATPAPSEPKVVEGVGLSATEQDALTQAKRDAVEKGIGVMLLSQTEVKNFMVEKDVVITKTMGAVKKYEVISTAKTPDGLTEIHIKAEVSLAEIAQDLAALKILLESMDKPRVMVLIQEIRNGQESPAYNAAVTAVNDFLIGKEFNMVDPAQVAALVGQDDATIEKAAAGNEVAAAKIGRDNGAELILVGKAVGATAPDNPMLAGMKSGQADITLKIINCQTGKLVAAETAHSAKPHINPETAIANALAAAGQKIMDREIFEKIVAHWQDMVNNGTELRLLISGVDNFSKFKEIKSFLETVSPNVVSITKRDWQQESGKLEFLAVFKGNSEAFSEYVDGKSTKSGLKLAVAGFNAQTVKISVK